jgi:uncharacterized metal-binding protein
MPSGTTHDTITALLAVPALAAAYVYTGDPVISVALAISFLFGGLMFGPDLDTFSKQYARWSIFRFIWFPYRGFFAHRSRFTHGLLTGTFIRLIYFMGAVTILVYLAAILVSIYFESRVPGLLTFTRAWVRVGEFIARHIGFDIVYAVIAGLWLGAASHTIADIAGSYIRTGKLSKLF